MLFYNTRTSSSIIMILPILVFFTLCSVALAENPVQIISCLTGIWTGFVKYKHGEDIKTEFTIKPAEENNDSYQYSLHYAAPRTCSLKAEELSVDDRLITLKFNEANGGFCEKLYHGKMTITISDDNHLSVLIKSKSGEIEETAILKKEIVHEGVQEKK